VFFHILLSRQLDNQIMNEQFSSYSEFVESEFPVQYQREVPEALKRAYLMADALMRDTSFLSTEGGVNARGHIIQCAVDYQLIRLIETGAWPFDFEWHYYARPTGKHLKILPKSTVVTVSRLQHDKQFPRNADFRNNQRLNNDPQQIRLFEDAIDKRASEMKGRPHLILGHGYHEPDFAHIYIPHSHRAKWNWSTQNLMKSPHVVSSDLPPIERPKTKSEPEIKEEFKEWFEKNERDNKQH
jgi:hypothetical protein